MAPSSEPSTKPITTSSAVMPACHSSRSAPPDAHRLRPPPATAAAAQTRAPPSRPGPHCHRANKNTANTARAPAPWCMALRHMRAHGRCFRASEPAHLASTNWLVYRSLSGSGVGHDAVGSHRTFASSAQAGFVHQTGHCACLAYTYLLYISNTLLDGRFFALVHRHMACT